ncbi:MAG: iron-sulfur cluster assembly accessory protein [Gammaproteobacteria bacterium]|nr:iron-sulfur cluster assembly accessory protein [Gammaproteobacteria bacterium]
MAITLSETAAERVQRFMADREGAIALRLGIRKTGCSGFAYVLDYAAEAGADDVEFEDHGVRILVRRDSLPMIDGTRVDFVRDGLNQSFRFANPNATDECGCGESFNA